VKLVIVESPAKAKTISRYLGDDFEVAATMGHVKDLPKSKLNVDVENDYEPTYHVIRGKGKILKELKKKLPKSKKDVYLALDSDREGEAIAAHVAQELKLKDPKRIVFHEITKNALLEAVKNPGQINDNLVDAQKARRILDRLVGYRLSELLWEKIWYGLSAGRVQSVATRFIVERERERRAFKPEEYWKVFAHLLTKEQVKLEAKLSKKNKKKYVPGSKDEIDKLKKDLDKADWKVNDVETKDKKQNPSAPFTTATLQRLANSYLGYSTKKTMAVAQQLYEGINVKGKGHVGLITYMRTDSIALANQAIKGIRKFVKNEYGEKYIPKKPRHYKTKSKTAQEAHEAIRPTDFTLSPKKLKKSLNKSQYKLYKLIWDRAVGCQMSPLRYKTFKISVKANSPNDDNYIFKLRVHTVTFDGFARVTGSRLLKTQSGSFDELSKIKKGSMLDLEKLETEQKFTKPRARYTEASLVKALEKHGIGRPSTYATIISTIQSRGYVQRDGKYLFPTDVGEVVTDFLVDHFGQIVDYDFTSEIEEDLDDIALGDKEWVPVIDKVYDPLSDKIDKKKESVKKEDVVILGDSDEKCPKCGGKMVVRLGRNGKFLSCADFPKCKGMLGMDGKTPEESLDKEKYLIPQKCEKCDGKMVLKTGKYGKFWACENYPDCKFTLPMLLKEDCPECGEKLVERKGRWGKKFIGCSGYPDCKYIKKKKKKGKKKKKK
jgi:DNA topoisomerase-1